MKETLLNQLQCGWDKKMGYQNQIAITGIATTAENKPSNGTVDGVDSFDTKTYAPVDPATTPYISAPDESAKYAGNVAAWGQTDAYGNNEYAYEVARNYLFINKAGINGITGEDKTKQIYNEQGKGLNFYELG